VQVLSGECAQAPAEFFGVSIRNELFDLIVSALPDWNRASKQVVSVPGEFQDAASPIGWVWIYLDQPAAFKRLQSGGQGGSIHCKQGCNRSHGRRLGAIQGHQKRKLPIGQFEGTQCFIESPCQGAGGALHMKTEAAVAYEDHGFVLKQIST